MKASLTPAIGFAWALMILQTNMVWSFSSPLVSSSSAASKSGTSADPNQMQPVGSILILDHLNINHEKGRHDWLKAFYFDFLKCSIDPRKEENLEKNEGTVWSNLGAHQIHLPAGKPNAQVLEGIVTLSYPNLWGLQDRYSQVKPSLEGSQFDMKVTKVDEANESQTYLKVSDPWGTIFHIIQGEPEDRDERGLQHGGDVSEGYAIKDLTFYTAPDTDLFGVARFYESVFSAPVLDVSDTKCVVSVGPRQTLSFATHPDGSRKKVEHEDLREVYVEPPSPDLPKFLGNYGPHISIYVDSLPDSYERAEKMNLVYVNTRFSRRAYTLDEAIGDCMFRVLEIRDPENPEKVLLNLEHEVRSVTKRDGGKYKSCPFDDIPADCKPY